VVTIEVPTLLPMLRIKFTSPETLFAFSGERDRHEQKTEPEGLNHAQRRGRAEADQQVETPRRIKHSDGQREPTERHDIFDRNFPGEYADHRHLE
jgi:hypothetical protein